MLALDEKQHLIQAIGRLMFEEVQNAMRPLVERIAYLENVLGNLPVPKDGKDGKDGANGKDADLMEVAGMMERAATDTQQWVRDYVRGALDALPPPKDGIDGKDGAQGKPGLDGKDGKDGADGRDGNDGENLQLADVRDCLADLVVKAVADLPVPRHCVSGFIDRDGDLSFAFSDGTVTRVGKVVGQDGKNCDMEEVSRQVAEQVEELFETIEKPKDGKDGVGFDDMSIEQVDERTLVWTFVKGSIVKTFNFVMSYPLFAGVWKEGEYCKGDCVIRDGSLFIATKDTKTTPATLDCHWALCTKRGRDGKDGKQGPEGPQGKAGRDGRDLTQMGPDGSKWP